ncbi:hypothetical protein HY251_17805 [bacterium]|nr:hypothetical protein [bacterium]
MADEEIKGYLRLNHFLGLRLESEDFECGEKYHIDKRRLHNKACHGRGVIGRFGNQFRVMARKRGDLSVEVMPGYAIDGEGNDIVLWEPKIVTVDPGKHVPKLPGHVFVNVKYVDEPSDFVVNKANPKFKGHRRVLETCRVDLEAKSPTVEEGIEVARVLITEETKEITDARDPTSPAAGEIDLRYVPRAGTSGSTIDADLVQRLREILRDMWSSLGSLARNFPLVIGLRELRSAVVTLQMLNEAGQLDYDETLKGVKIIIDLGEELAHEVDVAAPELNSVREYAAWKSMLDALRGIVREAKPNRHDLENMLNRLAGATSSLKLASDVKPAAPPPVKKIEGAAAPEEKPKEAEKPAAPPDAVQMSWQDLQKSSKLPKKIYMDGKCYDLVDEVVLLDKKSEADHDFAIEEARQDWTTNQTFKYPDKTSTTARGRAHVGGLSRWKIKNLKPAKELIIAKRIDFVRGDIVTRMEIDGQPVGEWKIDDSDKTYRWRNWLFRVPAAAVTKGEALCRQVAVEAERDINMFGLWFYQEE